MAIVTASVSATSEILLQKQSAEDLSTINGQKLSSLHNRLSSNRKETAIGPVPAHTDGKAMQLQSACEGLVPGDLESGERYYTV